MSWSGRFTVSMHRGEMAVGAVLLLFASAILWGAFQMSVGTSGAPGPGFFPRILGSMLVLISLGLIIRALRLEPAEDVTVALGHRDITLTVLALLVFGLVFEYAGFVLSATLFMLVLLRAFAKRGWLASIATAVAIVLVTYYAFVKLLGVSLPAGLLPFL